MNTLHPEEYVEKIGAASNLVKQSLKDAGFRHRATVTPDVEEAEFQLDLLIQDWTLQHMTPGMEA